MKTRKNAEMSKLVAQAIFSAYDYGQPFMRGYMTAARRSMVREGTFSLKAYLRGWRIARAVRRK